jgi:hypothetical protein
MKKLAHSHRLARGLALASRVLVSVALAVIATATLVATVVHSAYDSHENRAPDARIVVAAAATIVAFTAVVGAVRMVAGGGRRVWKLGAIWITAVLLLALEWVIDLASGPL